MRRIPNFKAIACLILVPAVLGVGVHFLHGYQLRRGAHRLLEEAEAAEKQGEFAKASALLRRYLSYEPTDNLALIRLGVTLDEEGKQAKAPPVRFEAYRHLDHALRRAPERADVRRRVAVLAMDFGDF